MEQLVCFLFVFAHTQDTHCKGFLASALELFDFMHENASSRKGGQSPVHSSSGGVA